MLGDIAWVLVGAAVVCLAIGLWQIWTERTDPADVAVPLAFALGFLLIAAVCAAVADKVQAAAPPAAGSSSGGSSTAGYPVRELSVPGEGFSGKAKLQTGPLPGNLCIYGYFDRTKSLVWQERSYKFWVRCHEGDRDLKTIADVRARLALPQKWGARNARARAVIPDKTPLAYFEGTVHARAAGRYPGGATQLRLLHFDRRWITHVHCARSAAEDAPARWAKCVPRRGDAPDLEEQTGG